MLVANWFQLLIDDTLKLLCEISLKSLSQDPECRISTNDLEDGLRTISKADFATTNDQDGSVTTPGISKEDSHKY